MIFNFDHSIHYLIPDLSDYNMTARTECVTPGRRNHRFTCFQTQRLTVKRNFRFHSFRVERDVAKNCTHASKGAVCSLSLCPASNKNNVALPDSFFST